MQIINKKRKCREKVKQNVNEKNKVDVNDEILRKVDDKT